nr:BTAD domain-containing putative transcriptional regulator [Caldilineaceae bacterium]
LFQQDRIVLLDSWLAALPNTLVAQQPALLSLQGAVRARGGHFQEGLVVLDDAVAQLKSGGESLELGYALVRRAVIQRVLGNVNQALTDGEQALALVARLEGREGGRALHAQALKTVGITLDELGRSQESTECLQQALILYRSLSDRHEEATVLQELARIHMTAGSYRHALALFEQALAMLRQSANLTGQAVTLNNLGVLYHLQGDILSAIDALEEAHVCAERSGYARFMVYSLASLGDVLADLDLWEATANVYRHALQGANTVGEKYLTLYLELALAHVATKLGNWEQAFARLDTAAAVLGGRKSGEGWIRYQMAMGQYYLACGRPADALTPLADATSRFGAAGQLIEQAIAGFYLAAAHQATGAEAAGRQILDETLAVTLRMETQRPLVSTLLTLRLALQELTPGLVETRQLSQLLNEAARVERELPMLSRKVRQQGSPMLQSWLAEAPPQLLIRALGRAEVVIDGRVVTNRDWQTQSARDLFFCLLAHPDGLTREQLGALFWPDASPNDLKTRFKNSIYRLRSALSEEVVRFDDDLYCFDRAIDYEYDVESFKSKLTHGNSTGDPGVRIASFEAALELYRGDYLPDVDTEWARLERAHLNRLFLETALTLGELQLEMNHFSQALATCERVLAKDSCHEAAHRLAMRIYAAMGSSAGVVRQYRLCEQMLLAELDVPPSPKTTELYELLTRPIT